MDVSAPGHNGKKKPRGENEREKDKTGTDALMYFNTSDTKREAERRNVESPSTPSKVVLFQKKQPENPPGLGCKQPSLIRIPDHDTKNKMPRLTALTAALTPFYLLVRLRAKRIGTADRCRRLRFRPPRRNRRHHKIVAFGQRGHPLKLVSWWRRRLLQWGRWCIPGSQVSQPWVPQGLRARGAEGGELYVLVIPRNPCPTRNSG